MTALFMLKYRRTSILFGVFTVLGAIDIIFGIIFGFGLLGQSTINKYIGDFSYKVPADWFVAIPALYVIGYGLLLAAWGRAGQVFIAHVNTNLEILFLMKQRQGGGSDSDKEKEPPLAK